MPAHSQPATTVLRPQTGDALVIVDLQRDFFAGGALPVARARRLLPVVNRAIGQFQAVGCPVVATRDWHPADHCSFLEFGGRWPAHCVQGTPGAEFVEGLELPADALVVSKGTLRDREAYSGFSGTELADWLTRQGIRRVFLCGVATEYCVLETAASTPRRTWLNCRRRSVRSSRPTPFRSRSRPRCANWRRHLTKSTELLFVKRRQQESTKHKTP